MKFSVIGYYGSTGQIFCHHVDAKDGSHAFAVVATEYDDAEFVVALPGHLVEGNQVIYPGESVVDATTVLDQPEVFGSTTDAVPDYLVSLVKEFPGFLTDEDVNGGDLVSWVDNHYLSFEPAAKQLLLAEFPGFEDDSDVNGADLVDWITDTFRNEFQQLQARKDQFLMTDVHKTVIQYTVLHDDGVDLALDSLEQIGRECREGPYVGGNLTIVSSEQLTRKQVDTEAKAIGSDPSFFDIEVEEEVD